MKWNDKQREIAKLFEQGKSFMDIVNAGYSKSTASRVTKALKAGEKPGEQHPDTKVGGATSLSSIKMPRTGVAVFTVGQEEVPLIPEDLLRCYDEYRDMKELINWQSDFSSTLREGIRLLRAVVCNYSIGNNKEEEKE